MSTTKWEDVRTNFVNGNRSDACRDLVDQPRADILDTVKQALENHFALCEPGLRSGDLTDLYEIIKGVQERGY